MSDTSARIIRTIHDQQNRFFLFSRETAQNTGLSYEALGVLAYLLSKPDDWTVRVSDLQKRAHGKKTRYGRGAIAAIMQELRTAGYAELKPIRDAKTGIVSGTEYWIYETPRPTETTEQPDFRRSEKPTVEKPASIEDTDSLQETEKDTIHAPNGAGVSKNIPNGKKPVDTPNTLPDPQSEAQAKKLTQAQLALYYGKFEEELKMMFTLNGIRLDIVPFERLAMYQRRAIVWQHVQLCRDVDAGRLVLSEYFYWLAKHFAWRDSAEKVHMYEFNSELPRYYSAKSTAAKTAAAPVQDAYSAWRAQTMADELGGI